MNNKNHISSITKYLIFMLLFALYSSGCSDSPFTPPGGGNEPAPAADISQFGLVEVTITGIGTPEMSASARPVQPKVAYNLTQPNNNTALKLDGDGDYATADGVSDALAGAAAYTIEAWVYVTESESPEPQVIFGFQNQAGETLGVVFYLPNANLFLYYDGATGDSYGVSSAIQADRWYHLALAIDNSNNGTLYINGNAGVTFTTTTRPESGGHFSLGLNLTAPFLTYFFKGRIGEVRIWNTARTQSQIQNNMNTQISPTTSGLVSYFRFNEASGSTVEDLAGSNDATLNGDAGLGGGAPINGSFTANGTIQLEAVSHGSFTYGTRGAGGVRYLYATFKVRNAQADGTAYGSPRTNLTFLAVDTDASFGEAETYGKTVVSKLGLFNGDLLTGSIAQDLADQMIPTGLARRTAGGTIGVQYADVLQVYTEDEIADLTDVPAGVSLFPYGFVTRSPNTTQGSRRIPANPATGQFDGRVTFAFKLPLRAQASQDPFEIIGMFLPVDDSRTKLTQSLEGQTADGKRQTLARAESLNAETVTIFPGSSYQVTSRLLCGPVRVTGTVTNPSTVLFPPGPTFSSLSPDHYATDGSAGHIPKTQTFSADFSGPVSGAATNTFIVRGFQSGLQSLTYSGNGSNAITTSNTAFFPGEQVAVYLRPGLGICPGAGPFRYRVETTAGNGNFVAAPDSPFDAGEDPTSVTLGDLNGDGKLDMAVTSFNPDIVSVRLGDGAGGFGVETVYGVGNTPETVALGDLNGDGTLDMVVQNSEDNHVSVLLGDGTGGFAPAKAFPADAPQSVAMGDLNGDGTLDMVLANLGSDNLSVQLGDGTGGFGPVLNFAVDYPKSVALGDLNSDGTLDIAVATGSNKVYVMLGDGTGNFPTVSHFDGGGFALSIALGDLNGDGALDITVGNYDSDNVSVWLGDGAGGFGSETLLPVNSPRTVVLGDLDGNDMLDMVVVMGNSDTVRVWLGNGDGSFDAPVDLGVVDGPNSVALGDLNGDGALDIVTANTSSDNVSVLLGQIQVASDKKER